MKHFFSSFLQKIEQIILHSPIFFSALIITSLSFLGIGIQNNLDPTKNISIWILLEAIQLSNVIIQAIFLCYLTEKIPHRIIRRILQSSFVLFQLLIFLSDLFLLYKYHYTLNDIMINEILSADPATINEFLLSYVANPTVLLSIISIIVLLIVLIVLFNYFLQKHIKAIVSLTIIFFISGIAIFSYISYLPPMLLSSLRVPYQVHLCIQNFGNEKTISSALDENPEAILHNNSDIPNVVLVLGESADRNHMHCYGYPLENTPFLDNYIAKGEAYLFTDTVSCGNTTTDTMKMIFSFAEKDVSDKPWYQYANLLDILKKAGYHTTWISNQSEATIYENMDKILSGRANDSYFSELHDCYGKSLTRAYDEVLLPVLDSYMKSNETYQKNFYVIHIEGSHEIYKLRFPEEFAKFTANDEPPSQQEWQEIQADYDNSILYTDSLLRQITERFQNTNTVLLYLSDHGSDVCNGNDFYGHSMEAEGSLHMIEVPFFLWISPQLRETHPELCHKIDIAKELPFRTDNTIHLLLDLMQIETTSFLPEKSPLSPRYDTNAERIYNGKTYKKN